MNCTCRPEKGCQCSNGFRCKLNCKPIRAARIAAKCSVLEWFDRRAQSTFQHPVTGKPISHSQVIKRANLSKRVENIGVCFLQTRSKSLAFIHKARDRSLVEQ